MPSDRDARERRGRHPKEGSQSLLELSQSGCPVAQGLPIPPDTQEVEIHREEERIVLAPVQVKEWPESFWRAFEGMPEDFERPPQVRQTRESFLKHG